MTREEKEKKLKEALARCIILDPEDRDFWLSHASMLPDVVLDNVTKIIEEKNGVVDEYVMTALQNDPDHKYLTDLKMRIKKIKEKAFSMDEKKEQGKAEEDLSKLLEDL
ncbi:MAG TPA: hypothetical protein VI588_03160 [Candidatus Gracilibacteria bacterium]|nr:hypothetical protein [Candidatus Gracilibacteria bacterium]